MTENLKDKERITQPTEPLISVIVAVFNAADSISVTIQSIRQQVTRNFEVLLIDGGSSDSTMSIVREHSDLFSVVVSESDSGISDAWNKGISKARGHWIIFLNSGDILHPMHFKNAEQLLSGREFNKICYCDVYKFDQQGRVRNKISGNNPTRKSIEFGSVGFAHPGSFTSSDVFEKIGGFDLSLKIALDTDFIMRCFLGGVTFDRFESAAYMVTGGVSDCRFRDAMVEYYSCLQRYDVIGGRRAKLMSSVLPFIRVLVQALRKFMPVARSIKHLIIALANILPQIVIFSFLRNWLFRIFGYKMAKGSTIGLQSSIYVFGRLNLGKRSVINRCCILDNRGSIYIGDDVSISRNVSIYTAGHDIDSPVFEMVLDSVIVRDHVVIFSGASIMPGVTIGEGAVVLPGAVVTMDVDAMSIVGGVPAKKQGVRKSLLKYSLDYQYPLAM